MTNSTYWRARSEEAWAQSVDMRDEGAQAMMEGIAWTYAMLATIDAKIEAETKDGHYVGGRPEVISVPSERRV